MTLPSSPPASSPRFERDEDGLVKGLTYYYTSEGQIDWRAMLPAKHLYVIREREAAVVAAQGKPIDECDLSLVNEKWLRIKIAGINYLANIRGYRSLEYPSFIITEGKASIVCQMEFIGNYETSGYPMICAGVGSACRLTMDKDWMGQLEAFAENRAFARCVKRALQIAILADAEVDGKDKEESDGGTPQGSDQAPPSTDHLPHEKLRGLCQSRTKPISFEDVKAAALKYKAELATDPVTWTEWASILPRDAWIITGKLEKAGKGGKGKS